MINVRSRRAGSSEIKVPLFYEFKEISKEQNINRQQVSFLCPCNEDWNTKQNDQNFLKMIPTSEKIKESKEKRESTNEP